MSKLQAFLDDTKVALDNGFGKTENIFRMFNALHAVLQLHQEYTTAEGSKFCVICTRTEDSWEYPCETIQAIERELG